MQLNKTKQMESNILTINHILRSFFLFAWFNFLSKKYLANIQTIFETKYSSFI